MNIDTYRKEVTSITYALEPLINDILREIGKVNGRQQEVDILFIENRVISIKALRQWLDDLANESVSITPNDVVRILAKIYGQDPDKDYLSDLAE